MLLMLSEIYKPRILQFVSKLLYFDYIYGFFSFYLSEKYDF